MEMIACVVPTIRADSYQEFLESWDDLFRKHDVALVTVFDGETPVVTCRQDRYTAKDVLGDDADLIYNKSDVVRNLGFAYIAKYLPDVTHILTLDDDTGPSGDTIQDHLDILSKRVPVSWMSTASEYMRGFPYSIRDEAEVVLSHGVWEGVADWDAPTQLVRGNRPVTFYTGVIPKGIYAPVCGMNVMFRRELLPYVYYAPMGHRVGVDRFGDIWWGVEVKKIIDEKGWAMVTGYASVRHDRASNVWANLRKEASGLEANEGMYKGEYAGIDGYFALYARERRRFARHIQSLQCGQSQ